MSALAEPATDPALLSSPAYAAMAARLTVPFARGADTLPLLLQAGASPELATVAPYDFGEHLARFDHDPEVSYLLRSRTWLPGGTTLTVSFVDPAFPGDVATTVVVPEDAPAGWTAMVPLPSAASLATRIASVTETRPRTATAAASPQAATDVELAALLGTTARLLWVLGAERDRLTQLRQEVRDQRQVETASGAGLDLIGADLAVPRFPPTPYSFDNDTIALWHLDDLPGASPAIVDTAAAFPGRSPHHGSLQGPVGSVLVGQPARYDKGVAFLGPGSILVASHPDFDVAASGDLTVECFVRPAASSALGQVMGRAGGWSVEVGDLGIGIANAVRATITDGATTLTAVAALDLPTDRFTHVAAVLDRTAGTWTVLVDGVPTGITDASALGAVGGSDITLGPAGTGFAGLLDEVRLSSTARSGFHPVLGESDERYRARLGLFRRWVLPTPETVTAVLNALVPELDGVAAPFVVTDLDDPMHVGHQVLRVWPAALSPHQTIDADGRLQVSEQQLWSASDLTVATDVAAQFGIDPTVLGRHANPQITYAPVTPDPGRDPGLPPADPHLMQPPVAACLDRLTVLLGTVGAAGNLVVRSGFDAAAADGRAVGRAVLLDADPLETGVLAALAHRAGFDFVEYRQAGVVYAATAPDQELLLGPVGSGPVLLAGQVPELTAGDTVTITVTLAGPTYATPPLPLDAEVDYALLQAGAGRGTLTTTDPSDPVATLTALAPGIVSISADVTHDARVVTASAPIVIRPQPLADGASIAADGTMGVSLDLVGPAEPTFDPAYLTQVSDPRIDFGVAPEHHQMQRSVARTLSTLADQLDTSGTPGLVVSSAYQPAAPPTDLTSRGRTLTLGHATLTAGQLAVAAHRAGFEYVARTGSSVVVASSAGDLVGVDGPDEVVVGSAITLTVSPDPATVTATTRLGWSSGQLVATDIDEQSVAVMPSAPTTVLATGTRPGRAWVAATLREAAAAGPYAMTVRLRPELAGARLSLDDYYLVMNALNTLHPVGVEVLTEQIRSAVIELGSNPSGLDPSFTYPAFRLHRAAAALRKDQSDG